MRKYCRFFIQLSFVVGVCLGANSLKAQQQTADFYERYNIYRNPIRVLLNKISITATSGISLTRYSHTLKGVHFLQQGNSQYLVDKNNTQNGVQNWLNAPSVSTVSSGGQKLYDVPFDYLENPVKNPLLDQQNFLLDTDTTDFGFKGGGYGIPIALMLHYEYEKYRLGVGFMYEKQYLGKLKPYNDFEGRVKKYEPNIVSPDYFKWYVFGGYKFHSFWNYDFVGEFQVGIIRAGSQFDANSIDRSIFGNLGISIENNWSEYFRVIIRPSIDIKSYTVTLPTGAEINHLYPTFYGQIGISINIPDIPRSPMKSDHVQLKHIYTDPKTGRRMEVRGQPIWKRQNPKVGENHRRLWRYKWKNRRKMNPY